MRKYYSTENILVRLLLVILLVIICFCSGFDTIYAEFNKTLKFDDTDLMDELQSIDGFDINDYPFDTKDVVQEPRVFNVVEYCYSFKPLMRANYGVYIYFYNPQGLQLNEKSVLNKVQMATAYKTENDLLQPTDYDKLRLKFCSTIENGPHAYKFYKFRVVDQKGDDGLFMSERVNSNNRQYDISGIELHSKGKPLADEYSVSGTYTFSGFASGYGPNPSDGNSITSTQRELESVELEVKSTFYRTGTSSLGKDYQNQLDSVYFAVPDILIDTYGELKRIKALWYEYKTNPIVVVEDRDIYTAMQKNLGKVTIANSLQPRFYADLVTKITPGLPFPTTHSSMTWGYNIPQNTDKNSFKYDLKSDFLSYIYHSENLKDFSLSGEQLIKDIYAYDKSYHTGEMDIHPSGTTGKGISADLFSNKIDEKHTRGYNEMLFDTDLVDQYFNMLDYDSTHSGWDKFFDYFLSYPEDEMSYYDIPPIVAFDPADISLSDEELSRKYLIDIGDVGAFKLYYQENKTDNTLFKFNFSHSQYYSNELKCTNGTGKYTDGFVAEQTVYLGFDIIYLEFKLDGVYRVIPVVSNPIDIAGDVDPPISITDPSNWWLWVIILLGIVAFIILLPVLGPLIGLVINLVVSLIKVPFKIVGYVSGGVKDAVSTEEKIKAPKNKKTKSRGKTKGTDDYYIDNYNNSIGTDDYDT